MGQKTHPVGYRLIVNKKWNSNWFASKNNFSSDLEEDMKIRKYISHRLSNAGISKVEIARSSKKVTVTIFTARPGMEMDLRGGGFVPIGAKEKADDVPARLSKNG